MRNIIGKQFWFRGGFYYPPIVPDLQIAFGYVFPPKRCGNLLISLSLPISNINHLELLYVSRIVFSYLYICILHIYN